MPLFILKRLYRKLWLRVTLYAVASLIAAGAGSFADLYLSDQLMDMIKPAAVMPVLTILASSMLAVSTFSLNVMVSAHRTAAENATPRVHRLLLEDTTTQAVLATFVGAFVFALTSIVLFQSGVYDERAAIVTMGVTVLVVVLVIVAILRWIEHLSTLGSLDNSLREVVEISEAGLKRLARDPAFGGVVMTPDTVIPTAVRAVVAPCSVVRCGWIPKVFRRCKRDVYSARARQTRVARAAVGAGEWRRQPRNIRGIGAKIRDWGSAQF